jgi:hypothetical protein
MKEKDHFDKIFWFLAAAVLIAFAYIFIITFIKVPEQNVRFADTAQGFFLGTIISSVISYFVGSSPPAKKTPSEGTTTADITATITTENKES